ncbi:anti-sigma factor family protein [Actinacidiphila guanduensis]|uniref:Zinc-finger domain-containing protein n=1 Tax=Actinacidiphila guanduensis TaxID=310781 RepID=A0A1G9XL72_9ACTN|nr:anti-sigma factor [Actinacidiphila guanduensis]SDM97166.1 hypothetical protein SAMN05216259_102178 [Actinacidiphila guanduensis]
MTSNAGGTPHPEDTVLSDLAEDLLPADRAAEVRGHIAGCEECAEVLASLAEIRSLLGSLPAPEPIPDDVAARIDAALAAEALLDATRADVPRETSPDSTAPTGPVEPPSPSAGHEPTSAPAPVNVPRETSTRPAGHPAAATGPGRSPRSGSTRDDGPAGRRARRRRRGVLAGVWTAAALVLGGAVYGITAAGGSGGSSADTSAAAKRTAGSTGQEQAVGDQVRQLLAASGTANRPNGGTPAVPNRGNTPMLTGPGAAPGAGAADVPSCVLKAAGHAQPPLATQRETFDGIRSYLLVLPHPGDGTLVDAVVVDASCAQGGTGTVLFQATYPR